MCGHEIKNQEGTLSTCALFHFADSQAYGLDTPGLPNLMVGAKMTNRGDRATCLLSESPDGIQGALCHGYSPDSPGAGGDVTHITGFEGIAISAEIQSVYDQYVAALLG